MKRFGRRHMLHKLAGLSLALLAGCAPAPEPTPTPQPIDASTARPSTPEPTAAPLPSPVATRAETPGVAPNVTVQNPTATRALPMAVVPSITPTTEVAQGIYAVSLVDVATGNEFTLAQLKGKPILLHPFALWGSICKSQQVVLDTVLSARPDEFWVVALDIDPNDGAELIRKRADDHPDVSVLWVISPKELTDMLVADHGPDILTPPRAPIVVVNAEQSLAQLLPSGIKRADALNAAVDGAM